MAVLYSAINWRPLITFEQLQCLKTYQVRYRILFVNTIGDRLLVDIRSWSLINTALLASLMTRSADAIQTLSTVYILALSNLDIQMLAVTDRLSVLELETKSSNSESCWRPLNAFTLFRCPMKHVVKYPRTCNILLIQYRERLPPMLLIYVLSQFHWSGRIGPASRGLCISCSQFPFFIWTTGQSI